MSTSYEIDVAPVAPSYNSAFAADVLAGLGASQRQIPARWFYDKRGSELFEQITQLPEYYPTRTERRILRQYAKAIAAKTGLGRAVVEFGSGSSAKTPLLLSAVAPSAYVPVDISGEFLYESAAALGTVFPKLPIYPVEGDFMHPLVMPEVVEGMPRLGFFPGSTIGNLLATEAVDLLRTMASTLGSDGMLLIGIDRVKSADVLVPAYDDAQGVTAAFNLNMIRRINRELAGTIPLSDFRHVARWNAEFSRIEMHLEAKRDLRFTVKGYEFSMLAGETIHTENSHKYSLQGAELLLRAGGWSPIENWTDENALFSVILASVSESPLFR
ncbi:L-histidine N(alpha)-methyltransferase [Duganella callida]|uniref:L-histidine N(Alpha)-methyltransferase n=1 Tax=Duganella callida TaxID=2561932 RepID=A0A4Y9SDL9_9BURK|nr:L-histidine N(alpha)-methyltransferase [Duganella callida]TFW18655.1 L-histidine N(alpha)-methyltransferase [Duganella callida]